MWKILNQPIFGTAPPVVLVTWREPFLCRLRLHGDYLTRAWIAFCVAVSIASLFFIAGFAETKEIASGLIAAAFGFFFLGAIAAVCVLCAPEAAMGSKVEIYPKQMRRWRDTITFYGYVSTKEYWEFSSLCANYVLAEDLGLNFSVLVLPIKSSRKMAIVCVPAYVDFDSVLNHFKDEGVAIERTSIDNVKRQPPYGLSWIVAITPLAVISVCVAIVTAVVIV